MATVISPRKPHARSASASASASASTSTSGPIRPDGPLRTSGSAPRGLRASHSNGQLAREFQERHSETYAHLYEDLPESVRRHKLAQEDARIEEERRRARERRESWARLKAGQGGVGDENASPSVSAMMIKEAEVASTGKGAWRPLSLVAKRQQAGLGHARSASSTLPLQPSARVVSQTEHVVQPSSRASAIGRFRSVSDRPHRPLSTLSPLEVVVEHDQPIEEVADEPTPEAERSATHSTYSWATSFSGETTELRTAANYVASSNGHDDGTPLDTPQRIERRRKRIVTLAHTVRQLEGVGSREPEDPNFFGTLVKAWNERPGMTPEQMVPMPGAGASGDAPQALSPTAAYPPRQEWTPQAYGRYSDLLPQDMSPAFNSHFHSPPEQQLATPALQQGEASRVAPAATYDIARASRSTRYSYASTLHDLALDGGFQQGDRLMQDKPWMRNDREDGGWFDAPPAFSPPPLRPQETESKELAAPIAMGAWLNPGTPPRTLRRAEGNVSRDPIRPAPAAAGPSQQGWGLGFMSEWWPDSQAAPAPPPIHPAPGQDFRQGEDETRSYPRPTSPGEWPSWTYASGSGAGEEQTMQATMPPPVDFSASPPPPSLPTYEPQTWHYERMEFLETSTTADSRSASGTSGASYLHPHVTPLTTRLDASPTASAYASTSASPVGPSTDSSFSATYPRVLGSAVRPTSREAAEMGALEVLLPSALSAQRLDLALAKAQAARAHSTRSQRHSITISSSPINLLHSPLPGPMPHETFSAPSPAFGVGTSDSRSASSGDTPLGAPGGPRGEREFPFSSLCRRPSSSTRSSTSLEVVSLSATTPLQDPNERERQQEARVRELGLGPPPFMWAGTAGRLEVQVEQHQEARMGRQEERDGAWAEGREPRVKEIYGLRGPEGLVQPAEAAGWRGWETSSCRSPTRKMALALDPTTATMTTRAAPSVARTPKRPRDETEGEEEALRLEAAANGGREVRERPSMMLGFSPPTASAATGLSGPPGGISASRGLPPCTLAPLLLPRPAPPRWESGNATPSSTLNSHEMLFLPPPTTPITAYGPPSSSGSEARTPISTPPGPLTRAATSRCASDGSTAPRPRSSSLALPLSDLDTAGEAASGIRTRRASLDVPSLPRMPERAARRQGSVRSSSPAGSSGGGDTLSLRPRGPLVGVQVEEEGATGDGDGLVFGIVTRDSGGVCVDGAPRWRLEADSTATRPTGKLGVSDLLRSMSTSVHGPEREREIRHVVSDATLVAPTRAVDAIDAPVVRAVTDAEQKGAVVQAVAPRQVGTRAGKRGYLAPTLFWLGWIMPWCWFFVGWGLGVGTGRSVHGTDLQADIEQGKAQHHVAAAGVGSQSKIMGATWLFHPDPWCRRSRVAAVVVLPSVAVGAVVAVVVLAVLR